jgi:hypothetical protein
MNRYALQRQRVFRFAFAASVWILSFGVPVASRAEDAPSVKRKLPLEAAFINQAVGSPFDGTILRILHPGFSLGTEYIWIEGRHGAWVQGLQAGYYFNKYDSKAVFLQSSFGYRYTLGFGLFTEIGPALGYLRYFHPTDIWRLNAEGEYEKAKDIGRGALMISIMLGLGYDFSRKLGWPLAVFFRYQPYIIVPDTPDAGTKWQAMLEGGIRLRLW